MTPKSQRTTNGHFGQKPRSDQLPLIGHPKPTDTPTDTTDKTGKSSGQDQRTAKQTQRTARPTDTTAAFNKAVGDGKCPLTPWPGVEEYTIAQRCSQCGAEPGVRCISNTSKTVEFGHARRQDSGARHYRRDVGRAPWSEDRVPGASYDTIGNRGGS